MLRPGSIVVASAGWLIVIWGGRLGQRGGREHEENDEEGEGDGHGDLSFEWVTGS